MFLSSAQGGPLFRCDPESSLWRKNKSIYPLGAGESPSRLGNPYALSPFSLFHIPPCHGYQPPAPPHAFSFLSVHCVNSSLWWHSGPARCCPLAHTTEDLSTRQERLCRAPGGSGCTKSFFLTAASGKWEDPGFFY